MLSRLNFGLHKWEKKELMKYLIQNLLLTVLLIIIEANGYDDKWIKQRLTGVVDKRKLTDLGEITTRELVKKHKPYGLDENRKVAKMGGHAAKVAREDIEKSLGESVVTRKNALNYKYIDDDKPNNNRQLKDKTKKKLN